MDGAQDVIDELPVEEIRRRLDRALLEQGVELNKRGVAPRITLRDTSPPAAYVPEASETDE